MSCQLSIGLLLASLLVLGLSAWLLSCGQKKGNAGSILIVLGSGGHTAEMLALLQKLGQKGGKRRSYVVAATDRLSAEKAHRHEATLQDLAAVKPSKALKLAQQASGRAKIYQTPRSREVGQSYLTSVWTTLMALVAALQIVLDAKPDLLLVNGPGTCIPICMATFVFRQASAFMQVLQQVAWPNNLHREYSQGFLPIAVWENSVPPETS